VYPVELCDFAAADAPAMHRMFGGVLIAANDSVAAEVLSR
jgi:hypothetical protein